MAAPVEPQLSVDNHPPDGSLPLDAVFREGEKAPSIERVDIMPEWLGEGRAMVLHHFLTPEECARVIEVLDQPRADNTPPLMVPANPQKAYRNCDRCVLEGSDVASVIFERLRPFLQTPQPSAAPPACIDVTPERRDMFLSDGIGMYGRWRLLSLNPHFRLCRYEPGGHFGPHYDGEFTVSEEVRSLKTFMIYLNEEYEGGTTNFCTDHELHKDDERNIFTAHPDHIRFKLKPRTGDCLVFDHKILHEGGQVGSGKKYIMRTDVLYERIESYVDQKVDRASKLLREAQKLEALGGAENLQKAVELYQKAFKLCPELERHL